MKFQTVKFIKTVYQIEEAPSFPHLPEIAVVGRSNVGKSTLLNHLFQSKSLVKTSSSPGKTQALNFFSVDGRTIFVDLPGYGFAKVPIKEKKQWAPLIENYLRQRENLKLLLFLLDIRHLPSKEDQKMFEWIEHNQLPTILVLTKVDKLKQGELALQTKRITDSFKGLPYVHYSAPKNIGRKQLISRMSEQVE